MKRGLALFLAALLTALALTACGGSDGGSAMNDSAASSDAAGPGADYGGMEAQTALEFGFDAPADAAEPELETPAGTAGGEARTEDRLANAKMVYTANVEAEATDFDACTAALEALVEREGGYLEYASRDSYGNGIRSASYTARIPSARFSGFLASVGEIAHVTSQNRNADNISERYYDTESRLTTQKTKMERLQALLAKAENMEDIISLETAISETELEIEQLTGSLRHYDALVDFATVTLSIREVTRLSTVEETPPTFGSRLSGAFTDGLLSFGDFLQDLAVFLAYNWLWLLVLALILLLVVKVSRRRQARRMGTEVREPGRGFFRRKRDEAKNPDDKQP